MTRYGVVYVIDDDASVRRAMRRLLQTAGHAVTVLDSADAFLALPEPEHPLCLVVDVRMPGVTGLDLLNALRARGQSLPIVLISGHGDAEMASRAMSSGALAFLTKPLDDAVLLSAVKAGLAESRKSLARRSEG